MGDLIAVYGAVVATIIGIIQFRDHLRDRRILGIRISQEFPLSEGYINLTITNLSDREVDIEFIGAGLGFRPWRKPWRLRVDEADGLKLFILKGSEDVRWLEPLRPGQIVYAEQSGRSDLQTHKYWDRDGFGYRPCILVTHSMSQYDLVEALI